MKFIRDMRGVLIEEHTPVPETEVYFKTKQLWSSLAGHASIGAIAGSFGTIIIALLLIGLVGTPIAMAVDLHRAKANPVRSKVPWPTSGSARSSIVADQ